jgi:predicted Fe-Mo cluster-binding NifX family protein
MKVAVSSQGPTLASPLDTRFGRAAYFLLVDTESLAFSVLDNGAQAATGGAGIAAAQLVLDNGAEAVITGQVGPNAMAVFGDTDLALYQGITASVADNIAALACQTLRRLAGAGPAHAGQGR